MAQTPFLLSTAASRCVFAGLLMGALVALGGCASPSTTKAPPTAVPDSFSTPGAQPTPDRWWTAFGSERLNTVVDSAAASNFPLRTAWQRFRAAQAVADRTPAALFPVIDGTAQGEASATQPPEGGTEQFQLDLNAAYEVDLWGRIQSRVAAEQFRTQATRADYQTAALSLSAEVVQTWVRWTEARSQRRLVNEQIAINRKVLNLLENRFRTGQIESVDVLRQRQLLESTREPRAAVESRIQMLEHQVAVLLGRPPQASVSAPPDTLPDLCPRIWCSAVPMCAGRTTFSKRPTVTWQRPLATSTRGSRCRPRPARATPARCSKTGRSASRLPTRAASTMSSRTSAAPTGSMRTWRGWSPASPTPASSRARPLPSVSWKR